MPLSIGYNKRRISEDDGVTFSVLSDPGGGLEDAAHQAGIDHRSGWRERHNAGVIHVAPGGVNADEHHQAAADIENLAKDGLRVEIVGTEAMRGKRAYRVDDPRQPGGQSDDASVGDPFGPTR